MRLESSTQNWTDEVYSSPRVGLDLSQARNPLALDDPRVHYIAKDCRFYYWLKVAIADPDLGDQIDSLLIRTV